MTISVFFSILSLLFTLIILWIKKRQSYFDELGFPNEPPSFPFGNLKGIGRQFHPVEIFVRLYKKFKSKGPIYGMHFFLSHNFVVMDLDVVKDILIKNFDTFHNRGLFYNHKDDPLTAHLLTLEDQEWRKMRVKMTPTFTGNKMRMMFGTVLEVSKHMIEKLKNNKNLKMIEIKEVLAGFTTDVIGNVAFGLEMNAIEDPDSKFRQMGKKFFNKGSNILIRMFFLTSFRKFAQKLRLKLIPQEISHFFRKIVKDTVEYRKVNKIQRTDVLDLLMKIQEKDENFTLDELSAQCFVFFLAGFETSSSTATFVLYNLALNQEIQEKLRREIKEVIERNNGEISYDGVKDMKYLQMVIDETLRMCPPIFNLIRKSSSDYKVPNSQLIIPKDSLTMIPVFAIHNDPEYYPQPEKFDPERFNDENKAKRHPMAFISFGDGPRNCIGFRFGLMQTRLALIQLLLNFKVLPTERTPIKLKFDPTTPVLSSETDMWLKIEEI